MNTDNLAHQFTEELKDKMLRAKRECRYNPTRFNQMIARHGGVETAKQLISSGLRTGHPSDGYTTLLLCGRLDLTMEHSVPTTATPTPMSIRTATITCMSTVTNIITPIPLWTNWLR